MVLCLGHHWSGAGSGTHDPANTSYLDVIVAGRLLLHVGVCNFLPRFPFHVFHSNKDKVPPWSGKTTNSFLNLIPKQRWWGRRKLSPSSSMMGWIPTPDIRLDGELIVSKTLRCSPLDWELGSSMGSVRISGHQPAQAKICHLHQVVLSY